MLPQKKETKKIEIQFMYFETCATNFFFSNFSTVTVFCVLPKLIFIHETVEKNDEK
jgi:hypothetical protein